MTTVVRRPPAPAAVVAIGCLLLGCGGGGDGGAGPMAALPAAGHYVLRAASIGTLDRNLRPTAQSFQADVYLSDITATELHATWDSPELHSFDPIHIAGDPNRFGDSYHVNVNGLNGSWLDFLSVDIAARANPRAPGCSGAHAVDDGGSPPLPRFEFTCTLTWVDASPPPRYENVAGTYRLTGDLSVAGASPGYTISGTLTLQQPDRTTPVLTGTASVTLTGGGTPSSTGGISQATSRDARGGVDFYVGQVTATSSWEFIGNRVAGGLDGFHTLTAGGRTYTGFWTAARQ